MNSYIKSTNIKSFTVTAYELTDKKASNNVVTYKVGDVLGGSTVKMEEYGNIYGNETAVLLKFVCTFIETTGKNYDVGAAFAKNVDAPVDKDDTGDCDLMCNLSEVLDFFGTDITASVAKGDTVTRGGELSPEEDGSEVNLNGGAASDGELTYTFYCIIDYSETRIQAKYMYALNNIPGCSLNSQMRFDNDMSFYVAET